MSETGIPNVLVVELSFFLIYHAVSILKFKKCKKTIFSKFFIATRIFKYKNSRPPLGAPYDPLGGRDPPFGNSCLRE